MLRKSKCMECCSDERCVIQASHKTGISIRIGPQTWTRSQLMQPFGRPQLILPGAMAMTISRCNYWNTFLKVIFMFSSLFS
jgi:hypothetical protein